MSTVAVRLNRGDGTFGARLIVPVGSEAFTVASGDFAAQTDLYALERLNAHDRSGQPWQDTPNGRAGLFA